MAAGRTMVGHTLTALVTLALVMAWLGHERPERAGAPQAAIPLPAPMQLPAVIPAPPTPPSAEVLALLDAEERVNIHVYATVNRAVVNITTAASAEGLFGDETSSGTGSGFVIDTSGHILTNSHVVEGAESIQVTLSDGSTQEAELVGQDASNDVAIVRVNVPAERLSPVALGDSSSLQVGQKVLALGNPFGLERTLTTGIISSLDRSLKAKNGRTIRGIIQTDAAINPGNSGGPLLNTRGQVIGMNTAILSQVGQSAGIGFAVPINSISRILKPLIERGRVIRADLGLTRVLREPGGLLIVDLAEGGPAALAGLRPIGVRVTRTRFGLVRQLDRDAADLITAIDGKPVRTVDELLTEVEAHSPGASVRVSVVRDGQPTDVEVTLGES
ncbi:trypsin-like peptidase domain-containing protein [Isosphaeraceae bacterium EP7]